MLGIKGELDNAHYSHAIVCTTGAAARTVIIAPSVVPRPRRLGTRLC